MGKILQYTNRCQPIGRILNLNLAKAGVFRCAEMRDKMAIRNIRVMGDEILSKVCKPVREMTDKNRELIQDMLDTMYEADGVGLAAPQVGILKRIAVVDVTEDRSNPIVMVNPRVVSAEGEQRGSEGCLSVPEKVGIVTRPQKVCVEAQDVNMKTVKIYGEGLLARALVHEIDHLEGHLYVERIEGRLYDVDEFEEEE